MFLKGFVEGTFGSYGFISVSIFGKIVRLKLLVYNSEYVSFFIKNVTPMTYIPTNSLVSRTETVLRRLDAGSYLQN